jgi:hypothetical protein
VTAARHNDGVRNAAYQVAGASFDRRRRRLVLDLADQTTVRSYVDPNDFGKGYVYDPPSEPRPASADHRMGLTTSLRCTA